MKKLCRLALTCCLPIAAGLLTAASVEGPFDAADRSYWAFQPVVKVAPPASDGATNAIDAFISAKLAEKNLSIAPRADKVDLIRRAYFDLIGVTPTPAEVETFVADESPNAFAKLVDGLLESPHYGERWGRHWLDLARYSDSNGFKTDETRPNAWRYRDYVIRSFNEDKPYDRFVLEQIAGDELWPASPDARIATAFNRHYPDESNAANLVQRRAELLQDVTDTVGATFLGMTFGCAKCHDHKFDAILQKDYYRLQAFFAASAEDDHIDMLDAQAAAQYQAQLAEWEDATADIRVEMESLLAPVRLDVDEHLYIKRMDLTQAALKKTADQLSPFEKQMVHKHQWQMVYEEANLWKKLKGDKKARYIELREELAGFESVHPGERPQGMGLKDLGSEAPPTHVLGLANYAAPKEKVEPGFLSILDPAPAVYSKPEGMESTGRRTALAHWLASPDNPLTARVMVNRLWHYHFGQGIVGTPSDFGRMGDTPTHPELLDWLAAEFVDRGWSLKAMHRLIMNSAAYQQSTAHREAAAKADPSNKLLWRFRPQRLDGEVIRDSMLEVAGLLNPEVGGPSAHPPLPLGMPVPYGGWDVDERLSDQHRRSIYIFVKRNARYPMMEAFDMPDTHESCSRRNVTTTAPQALSLLNDTQTIEWAQGFAGRVVEAAGSDAAKQVTQAYLMAYSRPPDAGEQDAALTFFSTQGRLIAERAAEGGKLALPAAMSGELDEAHAAALVDFCHALLNSNEFVYSN